MRISLEIGYDSARLSKQREREQKYIKKLNQFHSSISDTIIHLRAPWSELENHFSFRGFCSLTPRHRQPASSPFKMISFRQFSFASRRKRKPICRAEGARWRLSRWDYGNIFRVGDSQRDRICWKFPSPLWAWELSAFAFHPPRPPRPASPCPCQLFDLLPSSHVPFRNRYSNEFSCSAPAARPTFRISPASRNVHV